MIKILIEWQRKDNIQEKSFKSEMAALEWCRKNWRNIFSINFHDTNCEQVTHFDLLDYIKDRRS